MSDNFLLGLQDYKDASNFENLVKFLVERFMAQQSRATLVKVVRAPYNASGSSITPGSNVAVGYIDVQPLINQIDGYGNPVPHDVVYHLSYHRYQGGSNAFICDPVIGDIGKMVVADRDTSLVKATNDQSNPGSLRRGNFADGTYFGCPQASAPTQFFSWFSAGFEIHDSHGNTIQGTSSGVIINGVTITSAGEIINPAGTAFSTHTHPDPQGGNTGAPNVGS